jgi:Sulfotransferase domain
VDATPLDVVIAGVNKAGTTSLFVSLSEHPQVAPSAVKESRHFLPARYGEPVPPVEVYDRYFETTAATRVRLEATPSYFYGGAALARVIDETLPNARIVVVLREPVDRTISFFQYQKTRLRIPADMTIEAYLAHADALTAEDFRDPENERYFAVGGSRYADFLPGWLEEFAPDRILVVSFDDLTRDPRRVLRETAAWLGLDPAGLPLDTLASENRTTGFKSRRLQRVALAGNDRFERFLRRYPHLKRRARTLYFKVNGRSTGNRISDEVRAELAERFREPNRRLADQLRSAGFSLPPWLEDLDARTVGIP